jgi:hypothetical protein
MLRLVFAPPIHIHRVGFSTIPHNAAQKHLVLVRRIDLDLFTATRDHPFTRHSYSEGNAVCLLRKELPEQKQFLERVDLMQKVAKAMGVVSTFVDASGWPCSFAVNKTCPRSGKPISSDSLTLYKGYLVGFCNTNCRDDFAKYSNFSERRLSDRVKLDRAEFDQLIGALQSTKDTSSPVDPQRFISSVVIPIRCFLPSGTEVALSGQGANQNAACNLA